MSNTKQVQLMEDRIMEQDASDIQTAPVNPKVVANYFLAKSRNAGESLSPMKIQKLVYIAHGWHLALSRGACLIGSAVEAWSYGPVIPELYHEFKVFGAGAITRDAKFGFGESRGTLSEFQTQLLDRVWKVYGGLTAVQLANMTHQEGTPWKEAVEKKSVILNAETIKRHFNSLAQVK